MTMTKHIQCRAIQLNLVGYRLKNDKAASMVKPSISNPGQFFTTAYPYDRTFVIDQYGREKYSYANLWQNLELGL